MPLLLGPRAWLRSPRALPSVNPHIICTVGWRNVVRHCLDPLELIHTRAAICYNSLNAITKLSNSNSSSQLSTCCYQLLPRGRTLLKVQGQCLNSTNKSFGALQTWRDAKKKRPSPLKHTSERWTGMLQVAFTWTLLSPKGSIPCPHTSIIFFYGLSGRTVWWRRFCWSSHTVKLRQFSAP